MSVIIPTKESDLEILEGALSSIEWAEDILVVDSSFSDKIKNLADLHNCRYLAHKYIYSAKQKNWAIPRAKHNWVLLLDSDEMVTEKLRKTIRGVLASKEANKYKGFGIARKHFFFGKFLRWGGRYPLYNVRLFKRSCRYEDRDVHAHIILEKKHVKNIKPKNGDMLHFSDRNFTQFFERFNRYSTYQANYMRKIADSKVEIDYKKFFTNFYYFKAVVKDLWFFIPTTSFLRFFYMYVIKLGFLDGREGLMIATLYGFQDYVSKTKYHILTKKESTSRIKVQDYLIKKIALLARAQSQEEIFVKNYEEKIALN